MSTFIRIGQFAHLYFLDGNGRRKSVYYYQNALPNQGKTFEGVRHSYLGFVYQGATKNRTGDNIEADIILSTNEISTTLSRELLAKRHYAIVTTVQFDNGNNIVRTLTKDYWTVASLTYDAENIEIILSSAIDAVGAQAPNKVLTRDRVGDLPVTANIIVK